MIESVLGKDFSFFRNKVIGSGDFGTNIFEGQLKDNNLNLVIAVKRIIDQGFIEIEKEILRNLIDPSKPKHLNIVHYYALKRDLDFW